GLTVRGVAEHLLQPGPDLVPHRAVLGEQGVQGRCVDSGTGRVAELTRGQQRQYGADLEDVVAEPDPESGPVVAVGVRPVRQVLDVVACAAESRSGTTGCWSVHA